MLLFFAAVAVLYNGKFILREIITLVCSFQRHRLNNLNSFLVLLLNPEANYQNNSNYSYINGMILISFKREKSSDKKKLQILKSTIFLTPVVSEL